MFTCIARVTSLAVHFLTSNRCQHLVYYLLVYVCCQVYHLPCLVCILYWNICKEKAHFGQCFLCPPHIVNMDQEIGIKAIIQQARYFKTRNRQMKGFIEWNLLRQGSHVKIVISRIFNCLEFALNECNLYKVIKKVLKKN